MAKKKEEERVNPFDMPVEDTGFLAMKDLLSGIAPPEKLAPVEVKESRSREWDKSHAPKCYRGVPGEIKQEIKEIAGDLGVSADEVARVFIEYAIDSLAKGRLSLKGVPSQKRIKMTLYPVSGAGWSVREWDPRPPEKKGRHRREEKLWKSTAMYRIPQELHDRVKEIAGEVYPVGEVVSVFLKHGIEGYKSGVLVLTPQVRRSSLDWK